MSGEFGISDWIQLVQATRQKFFVSIDEAHDIILADEELRRLVATLVNRDQEFRKLALASIRKRGDESPFERGGDRISLRRS